MFKPIRLQEFLERSGVSLDNYGFETAKIKHIISLRDMSEIQVIFPMERRYLEKILFKIQITEGDKKVYQGCEIKLVRMDPYSLKVGQTFVQRNKYVSILENFKNIFEKFTVSRGLAKLTSMIVIGKDREGNTALAHYLPPIIEMHNSELILMDGIHRNFIGLSLGTTLESIVIENVQIPFPCSARKWDEIKVVETKPEDIKDRFFDLKKDLFRDLKNIGIDG